MAQEYLLTIKSPSGLESKELKFDNLYFLFDYIKKNDNPGFEIYEIRKRVGYAKNKV